MLRMRQQVLPVPLGIASDPAAAVESWTLNVIDDIAYSLGKDRPSRMSQSFRSIESQVSSEYRDRVIIELIQNAFDAHPPERTDGRIQILLDYQESEFGVLYVANGGIPFLDENFESMAQMARSKKKAGRDIGHKGVGFRSVLLICDRPEIYSSRTRIVANGFDGYCFGYASPDYLAKL
ncbi:MAG: sensor histidine kinase, partial [Verrucomicrobia bacterium]|nr:sensor histidine kinase [Verrucomicrobiota bacterium]